MTQVSFVSVHQPSDGLAIQGSDSEAASPYRGRAPADHGTPRSRRSEARPGKGFLEAINKSRSWGYLGIRAWVKDLGRESIATIGCFYFQMKAPNLRSGSPRFCGNVDGRNRLKQQTRHHRITYVSPLYTVSCDTEKPICPRNFFQRFCCSWLCRKKIRYFLFDAMVSYSLRLCYV